jgi:hypothetical protein
VELEPWRGRPVGISAHAIIRWLERVGGVELGPMRRVAAALFVAKKASDKATLRLIETGFGLSLDPIRRRIREAFDEGVVIERPNKADIVLPSGHALAIVRNPDGGHVVLTVLSPGMLLHPAASPVDSGRVLDDGVPEGQGDLT